MSATGDLFPEPGVDRTAPLGMSEPAVHFLTRVTTQEACRARANINAWYAGFPDPHEKLRRSITSEDDRAHYAALDELFIHQELLKLGFDVRYEEGSRGPDFRCYRNGIAVMSVEVASLLMKEEWEQEEKAFGRLADAINEKARPRGFFVHLAVIRMERTPSATGLSRFIERWIDSLPEPTAVSTQVQAGFDLPTKDYIAKDVHIRAEAWPIRQGAPSWTDPNFRLIGVGPAIGGIVDSHSRVLSALDRHRASRYELDEGACYVIVVGNHDMFCSLQQVEQALYGPDHRAVHELAELEKWERQYARDAFFGINLGSGTRKNTRVAAVGIFDFFPWDEHSATLRFLEHPQPWIRAKPDLLPLGSWFGPTITGWKWNPPPTGT